jgi:hypothetical protein
MSNTKTLALALCAFTSLAATGLSAGTAHAQTADTGGILFQVQAGVSSPISVLIGHWRATSIVFDSPRDEHLVLYPDGTAKYWVVTASSRSEVSNSVWGVEGRMLKIGEDTEAPITIYEGQLVLPNIPNRRKFWERIE